MADVRVWFYAAIEPLAPARLMTRRSGDLLARIVADVETLEDFYVRVVMPPIVAVLVTAFACVLVGLFDVTLGFVLLSFLVVVGVVLPLLTRWLSREVSERSVRTRGELSATIVDEVNGLADLIALDRADGHRATVLALGGDLDRHGGAAGPVPGIERRAGGPAYQRCVPLPSWPWPFRSSSAARWTASISRCCRLPPSRRSRPFSPCRCPSSCSARAGRRPDASSRSSMPAPVEEPAMPVVPPVPGPLRPGLAVDIRGVTFRYDPGGRACPGDVSFSVPAGGGLAIVGPSGSGKSTLVNLLLRFWDYSDGEVLVGGCDLRQPAGRRRPEPVPRGRVAAGGPVRCDDPRRAWPWPTRT